MDRYRRVIPKKTLMIPCAKTLAGDILNFLVFMVLAAQKVVMCNHCKKFYQP
jgi:hypothetical protein